jgi:hypothetical protein
MNTSEGSEAKGVPTRSARASRRPRRPAAGTMPADTRGGELERRVARLEFAEGALARLRVLVPADDAEPGRDILTDLDVLSIDVGPRLRMQRSLVECKSGQGQSGEPVTLIWLAGLRQLLRLDRIVFARPSVSSRGRALARRLGIGVLDEETIAVREDAHRWLPARFGHIDGPECVAAEARTVTQLKGLPGIPAELGHFLRGHALLADSPALLAAVESLGTAVQRQGGLPEPTAKTLGGHALGAVILAGVRDAARLDELSVRSLRSWLERGLTTGDPEDEHLLPLMEKADALVRHVVERTHRAYVDAGAEPHRIDVPSLRDLVATPPAYLDDYLDFVLRLRTNPLVSRDLLQTHELACFEALLGGDAWKASAFAHLFTAEHLGLLQVALRCLGRIAGPHVADSLSGLGGVKYPGADGWVPDRRGLAPTGHQGDSGQSIGAVVDKDSARDRGSRSPGGRAGEQEALELDEP